MKSNNLVAMPVQFRIPLHSYLTGMAAIEIYSGSYGVAIHCG